MVPVGLATGGAAAGAPAVELPLQPAQQSATTVVIANTNFIVLLIVTSLRSSSLPEPDKIVYLHCSRHRSNFKCGTHRLLTYIL
jgi:hypothetical protein